MQTILFLILVVPTFALAGNFMGKSKVKTGNLVYTKKQACEQAEGEKCFDISGKDMRRFKAGFQAIDIPSTADCADLADCEAKRDASEFTCDAGNGEVVSFDDKANWPLLDFTTEGRLNTGWFLWCQKEELVDDSAGSTAADTEDSDKAADKAARDAAKAQRKTDKDACVAAVNGGANLTAPEIKDCIRDLVKEVFENDIATGDL